MHLGFCHWRVYLLKSITNIIARSRNRNIAIIKTRTTRFNSDWNKGWGIASSTSTGSQKNSDPKKFRPTRTLVYQKLRPPKKLRPTRSMLEILVNHWTLPDQILNMSGQLYIMIHHDDWKSPQYILNHQFVKCLTKRKIWKGLQYKNYFEQQDYKCAKNMAKLSQSFWYQTESVNWNILGHFHEYYRLPWNNEYLVA